jgi:hypothetical protein
LQYNFYNFSNFSSSQAGMSNAQGFGDVFFIVVLVILLLQLRTRRVKLFGLVVMPFVMLLLTLSLVAVEMPSSLMGIALIGLGFIVGIGVGLAIGSMMEVKVDEKDGAMVLKGSILAVLVWAVIIGLKIYGKGLIAGIGIIDVNLLTTVFLVLTVGTMIGRRGMVYWRYLEMKKAAKASPTIK